MVEWIAKILIFLGLLAMAVAGYLFLSQYNNWQVGIDSNRFDHYGSFVGGVTGSLFSLASVLFLIKTLRDQQKQQIEGRFFELLRYHREHVEQLKIGDLSGSACFPELIKSFKSCFEFIKSQFNQENLDEPTLLNLSYLAFFFGTFEPESRDSLKPLLKTILESDALVDKVFEFVNIEFFRQWLNPEDADENTLFILSEGYRSKLGHYFRHLLHTVRYVNGQKSLNYNEKYHLVKTLRAQMSDEEELLLFFNSLSSLGSPWEKGVIYINEQLITKYNLIKNIPEGLWPRSELEKYYPDVKYQGDFGPTKEKQRLIRHYKCWLFC